MNQNSIKLPALGSSVLLDYLVKYTTAIDPVSLEDVSFRPHVFFYRIGRLDFLFDPPPPEKHYGLRLVLTDYKERLKDNAHYAIVLDYSHEGPAFDLRCAAILIALHELLAELNIPATKVFFTQQNRLMMDRSSGYYAWCARTGTTPIRMRYAHWWILDQAAKLHLKFNTRRFGWRGDYNRHRKRLLSSFALGGNEKTHKYLCFNYFPRLPRIMLLLQLLEQDLLKEGLVSFPGFRIPEFDHDFMEDALLNIDDWKIGARLKPLLPRLQALAPLRVDGGAHQGKSQLENHFVDEPYLRTVFSVVTETEFSNGYDTHRVTEKFLKAAAHMHPFMISGNPHSLVEIRRLGFQTFAPFFDEAYDEMLEPEPRMAAILGNIKRKCSLSLPDLMKDVQGILPIIKANLNHVANGLWERAREESEYPLLKEFREAIDSPDSHVPESYRPVQLNLPKGTATLEEIRILEDSLATVSLGVEFEGDQVYLENEQRSYVKLRESATLGDHYLLFRTNRDLTLPFLFSFDVKSGGVERITVDLKAPTTSNFRGTFDLKLGIFIESSNLDHVSTISSIATYVDDDWYRLSFRGRIGNGATQGPLDIAIYLVNSTFVYEGNPFREVWLSQFSLKRFAKEVVTKTVDEVHLPKDLQGIMLHDVEFDFTRMQVDNAQRTYVKLQESPTLEDHCVVLRVNRDLTLPFRFSLEVRSQDVARLAIELKETTASNYRGIFDFKTQTFFENSNLDSSSSVVGKSADLGDGWFRLTFMGQIGDGTVKGPLDINISLLNPDFVYEGIAGREVWLSNISLSRISYKSPST